MNRYQAYIHSEEWRARRLAKLEQAHHRCQKKGCPESEGLSVHHLTYARLGQERSDDLVVLCRAHHWVADAIRKGVGIERSALLDVAPPKPDAQCESERQERELLARGWEKREDRERREIKARQPMSDKHPPARRDENARFKRGLTYGHDLSKLWKTSR